MDSSWFAVSLGLDSNVIDFLLRIAISKHGLVPSHDDVIGGAKSRSRHDVLWLQGLKPWVAQAQLSPSV